MFYEQIKQVRYVQLDETYYDVVNGLSKLHNVTPEKILRGIKQIALQVPQLRYACKQHQFPNDTLPSYVCTISTFLEFHWRLGLFMDLS